MLRALVDAGADLILAGHIHQAAVSERHEFEVVGDEARTAVVAIAPGLGQPRPRRLGEARGLHLHEADDDAIVVRTFLWSRGDWALERRAPLPALGAQALEQAHPRRVVLVVVEDARVVELLEQAEVVRRVVGRAVAGVRRGRWPAAAACGGLACKTPNGCWPIWSGSMPARFSRSRYCSTPKPRSGKRRASFPQSGRFWTKRR